MYKKAKESLRLFIEEWKKLDWIMMYKYTQKTWQHNHPQLVTEMPPCQQYLHGIQIIDYKIGKANKSNDFAKAFKIGNPLVCIDIIVEIEYNNLAMGEEIHKKKGKLRMICEKGAYNLSEKGEWGINILSILKMGKEKIKNEK